MSQTFLKTIGSAIVALANCAGDAQIISSPIDTTAKMFMQIFARYGRNTTSVYTNPLAIRIEGSSQLPAYTGPQEWYVLAQFNSQLGNTVVSTPVSGTAASGQKNITLTTVTSFAVQDIVYIKNGTIGNSEWGRIASISGSVITLEDNLANAQTGSTVSRGAEYFASGTIDLSSVAQVRVVVDNSNNNNSIDAEAWASFANSIG